MRFNFKQPNIGNVDHLIRAITGALMIITVFLGGSWFIAVIGAVLVATAYLRFCPFYALFNFRSNKKPSVANE